MPAHSHITQHFSITNSSGTTTYGVYNTKYSSTKMSFSTNNTGNGNAHNNMPPYYVLTYIMKIK